MFVNRDSDVTISVTDKVGNVSDEVVLNSDKDLKPEEKPEKDDHVTNNNSTGARTPVTHDSWNKSYMFWWEQEQKIRSLPTDADILIKANGRQWMPKSTMELLYDKRPDIRVIIKWNKGQFVIEPQEALKPELGRIHYLLEKLQEEYIDNEIKD